MISMADKEFAIGIIEMCGGGEALQQISDTSLMLELPHGDGVAARRLVGKAASVGCDMCSMLERLYLDGGRLLYMHIKANGQEVGMTGDEWERASGVHALIAEVMAKAVRS